MTGYRKREALVDEKLKDLVKKPKRSSHIQKIRYESKDNNGYFLQELIPPWTIVHLSSKASFNDILSERRRHALYSIGILKARSFPISNKQKDYLEDILEELIQENIVNLPCEKKNCERCSELERIFS